MAGELRAIRFETSVVGMTETGDVAMALMIPMPAPFEGLRTCVVLLTCSQEAAAALCASVAEGSNEIEKRG